MRAQEKTVVKHQLYRSGGREVVLDQIVYHEPATEGGRRTVDYYVVREARKENGEIVLGHRVQSIDLQPLGRVVQTLEVS